ncbi:MULTISPECIES: carboxysome shell carbonic anhydrase [Prochlorococcus]|uniref:Carboxysome shell carbonic anhydrase n=1 Tax=Prochlorococcus marinus (strain SARG / CCMP1375 / SS120) TaxID=167539 RepID=Q7VD30_PROMA|nr:MULTISPECIES: carboxysome shell carbonic anhydrase [Prochlorococcus]AAP99599.1 Carboxysome shell polypeptide, CsoS3 [Prochlorococcus marinus subsp. marinus str. CCMP1375]KGG11131.1 carboxysome shell protein CsoS3 [Prochlorococcus marinus str. LG]KGG21469.1 carboxysome shell protein CsoS3 [Prochlorococcus marinus str. SS2]KGG23186.1 carboxysome shell protein CsoS3 [Prochlorococcus marinus str. SS35]KGG33897.1 carboxysome shell protein CsoS3 [Prochlorococcus marinus str. SS51]
MAYRHLARKKDRFLGPTAPRKRHPSAIDSIAELKSFPLTTDKRAHPLTDLAENNKLQHYESEVKGSFEKIVPLLQKISALQHDQAFVERAQKLAKAELGFELPKHILDKAWVRPLDMRALFAWCVFEAHKKSSNRFFNSDPLNGGVDSSRAKDFETFLSECGFHLLDVTPCSDGRLAHSIAYVLRIPFSSVRRRSHAGAMFDVENTVNRWIKTEHKRYRENSPNSAHDPTCYLKVVLYHFSSLDPSHQGCAAHGSDDSVAAASGLQRLLDFRESVENSFCCGASVDLLLIGIDTDTDAIRVHVPDSKSHISLEKWVSTADIYQETKQLSSDQAILRISEKVNSIVQGNISPGMIKFIIKLITNNISQIDYVRDLHDGPYPDAGHAERFIGVGIGFKEVHLRNLTYFAHLDTVEEGAPDLDVGIKIFSGLNVSRDLPIPVVVRFDYSGRVPGARERALSDCKRVDNAISSRYRKLVDDGLLHTCLTIRDRDAKDPAEVVGSSLDPAPQEEH